MYSSGHYTTKCTGAQEGHDLDLSGVHFSFGSAGQDRLFGVEI